MAGSGTAHLRPEGDALLRVEQLVMNFPVGRSGLKVHAVSDVSLDVKPGETLGLVGESGCGKSTTGKAIMQLPRPTSGRVLFEGADMTQLQGEELRRTRTRMKMIFQDPISSLNPRRRVEDIIAEGLRIAADLREAPVEPPTSLRVASILAFVFAVLNCIAYVLVLVLGWSDHSISESIVAALALTPLLVVAAVWRFIAIGLRRSERAAWTGGLVLAAVTAAVALVLTSRGNAALGAGPLVLMVAFVLLLMVPSSRHALPQPPDDLDERIDEMMATVGLDPSSQRGRRPHEFSGGQCQRISIARVVVTDPRLIICDEPVSALDVSVQAQILNLLEDMKKRYGLTLIFIAHDLAVVKNVSDRVIVMYLGKICEVSDPDTLYRQPAHPYTRVLLDAIPVPDPDVRPDERMVVPGEMPSPVAPPSGCRFRTRCPKVQDRCAAEEPVVTEVHPGQFVACHFPLAPGETLPTRNGSATTV